MEYRKASSAIVGLGITPQGKVFHTREMGFAVEAVAAALDDAGLARDDLDGLLVNPGVSWKDGGLGSFHLQQAMELRNLRLSATMNLGGATAIAMIAHAAMAIAAGQCTTVACVFSDAPLRPPRPDAGRRTDGGAGGAGASYAFARGLDAAYGQFGMTARYALVARRHMHVYGTTSDHLAAVAVAGGARRCRRRAPGGGGRVDDDGRRRALLAGVISGHRVDPERLDRLGIRLHLR